MKKIRSKKSVRKKINRQRFLDGSHSWTDKEIKQIETIVDKLFFDREKEVTMEMWESFKEGKEKTPTYEEFKTKVHERVNELIKNITLNEFKWSQNQLLTIYSIIRISVKEEKDEKYFEKYYNYLNANLKLGETKIPSIEIFKSKLNEILKMYEDGILKY